MIPKIIHYCWLGTDPYPEKVRECIASWKRVLPDYEIKLWDNERFDMQQSAWVREACERKKYAFAADYIRCYALYTEGGIYLDSDVEVLKRFDDLLELPYFLGRERVSGGIEAATMGAEKGLGIMKDLLAYYDSHHFVEEGRLNTTVMPQVMQQVMGHRYRLKEIESIAQMEQSEQVVCVLPSDYFSPKENEQLFVTENTYSIHHYTASWRSPIYNTLRKWVIKLLGVKMKQRIAQALKKYGHKKQ